MSALASQWGGDPLVSPENSRRMAAKIHAHGGVAEERTYRGVGHLTLIGAAPALRVLAPVLREVTQFVWSVTCVNSGHFVVSSPSGWIKHFHAFCEAASRRLIGFHVV
jgi:hypothetical protein